MAIASRQARRLACFIFDARATVGTFLAGVVFAVLCMFWLLQPRLHLAPDDIGSLNMIHCGHVNLPNLLKHGTILKAAADTRGSSLFDGGRRTSCTRTTKAPSLAAGDPTSQAFDLVTTRSSRPLDPSSKTSFRRPTLVVQTSDDVSSSRPWYSFSSLVGHAGSRHVRIDVCRLAL